VLGGILKEPVPGNGKHACSAEKTLKLLAERYYAGNGSDDKYIGYSFKEYHKAIPLDFN